MRASEELLGELHGAVAQDLLRRIRSGEATGTDIANALKMLKDNGIEVIPTKGSALGDLLDQIDVDNVVNLETRIGSR